MTSFFIICNSLSVLMLLLIIIAFYKVYVKYRAIDAQASTIISNLGLTANKFLKKEKRFKIIVLLFLLLLAVVGFLNYIATSTWLKKAK